MDHSYASKVASIIGAPLPINAAATILQELNKAYAQGMANGAAQEREALEGLYDHEDVQAPVGNSAYGEAYQEGWIAGAQAYRDAIRSRGKT